MFYVFAIVTGLVVVMVGRIVWDATTPTPTKFSEGKMVWLKRSYGHYIPATIRTRHWSPRYGYIVAYESEEHSFKTLYHFVSTRRARKVLLPRH